MGQCVCFESSSSTERSLQSVDSIPHTNRSSSSRGQLVVAARPPMPPDTQTSNRTIENGLFLGGSRQMSITDPRQTTDSAPSASRSRQEIRILVDSNLASPVIDSLVLQTLAIIRTLVDNEQPPPDAMLQLHKIADIEIGWLAIVYSMIDKITSSDPLGPAVITLILDECPLPSKEAIMKLTQKLDVSENSAKAGASEPMRQRNICILYGFLAEKLAGATSVALLSDVVLSYLIENLRNDKEPYVILHAIVALEKFALTTENKNKILDRLGRCGCNPLLELESWRNSMQDYLKREVGFCAEWTLDNLFVPNGREFTYEKTDNSNLNAMLNSNDTSEYLKISPSGLEARSDVLSFESVRCTFQIDSGAWYYEVELVTNGVLQIGWATKYSKFLNYDGFGIGDDEFSLAYDGCRQLIWHNAQSSKHSHPCWHPGDILGCYLNIETKEAIFSLNGVPLSPINQIFQKATKGFFAAASFMTFQQCIFNFGSKPFKYPPSSEFYAFNDRGSLELEERHVLPRHKKIETLRRMSLKEDGCQLCFDNHANVILQPCGHKGFCLSCVMQLDTCPLCRTGIDSVDSDHSIRTSSTHERTSSTHERTSSVHERTSSVHERTSSVHEGTSSHLLRQLSHDKSAAVSENQNNQDQTVK